MRVLLSIKPEFAEKIFSGEKKYEFRKTVFKNQGIRRIVVYASAPISRVIGEFEIGEILTDEIPSLWKTTKAFSGITKKYFLKYFSGLERGHAIEVKKVTRYSRPIVLKTRYGIKPPQSFAYVK